jgi:hypothetical protein
LEIDESPEFKKAIAVLANAVGIIPHQDPKITLNVGFVCISFHVI